MALSDDMRQAGVDSALCDRAGALETQIVGVKALLAVGLRSLSQAAYEVDREPAMRGNQV